MDEPTIYVGRYRHWKGQQYDVVGIGIHTETNERFVVYTDAGSTHPCRYYLRPVAHFLEPVEVGFETLARFVPLSEPPGSGSSS